MLGHHSSYTLRPESFSHTSFTPTMGIEFETFCQDTLGMGVLLREQTALSTTHTYKETHTHKRNLKSSFEKSRRTFASIYFKNKRNDGKRL